MNFRKTIFLLLFTVFSFDGFSQELEMNIEELLLEQISEDLGDNVDVSEVIERLNYYLRHPLDLNKATEEELANLMFLSSQQIANILLHREVSGDFISLLELQGIVGFDLEIIARLRFFVKIGEKFSLKDLSWRDIRKEDEHMLMLRYGRLLESQQGYHITDSSRSRYLGDPNRYALRYRWNYQQKIKVGINAEKDAGEPFFANKQKFGFDYYSGYFEINEVSKVVQKIVIGDYALQIGQGLIAWNGLSFGKGAWIGAVAKQGMGLRSYSSMNENNFQRGVSAKIKFDRWEWIPFVAYNRLSGNLVETDSSSSITTINYSGLHRTPTELSYRKAVGQWVFGSDILYNYKRLKVGFTYMHTKLNGSLEKDNHLRNQFDFDDNNLHQLGVNYKYTYRNFYLFGETAHSLRGGWATVNGMIASLHPKVSVFVNYRNFQRNYHTFFGQALAEGSNVSNEKGIYTGLTYHITRRFEWINYVDIFEFPWLRFRADGPSRGTDFLSQATYTWYKKGKLSMRYRHRLKEENLSLDGRYENMLAQVIRNQFRLEYQYKLNDTWNIKSRVELALFEKEQSSKSKGYLVYQDVYWKNDRKKLNVNLRFSYFDTQDYDSRIYAYESDVLYASSFPMYYDKGFRSYLNTKYRLNKTMEIWVRYAITNYFGRETIGSGLDLIEGNKRSDVKFQVRWQW